MTDDAVDLGPCLVTGGAGFVAGHLIEALLARGHRVRSIDLRAPAIERERFESVAGDLTRPGDVERACEGIETVFHTAAIVDFVGFARPPRRARSFALNVGGTKNVIAACRSAGVRRLVYTSTNNMLLGPPYVDLYSITKAEAEAAVLAADGVDDLSTCALRPGGIYGAGDPFFFPAFIDKCVRGLLVADIGDGRALADNTFVGNLVHAELLAAERLGPGSEVSGHSYCVNDGAPMGALAFFEPILDALGYDMPKRRLPFRLMYGVGYAWELLHRYHLAPEPLVTRLETMKAGISHAADNDRAARDFGYAPIHDWREARAACVPYCLEVHAAMKAGTWSPGWQSRGSD